MRSTFRPVEKRLRLEGETTWHRYQFASYQKTSNAAGIHSRVRKRVMGTPERPRLCVYRSLGHIYAQIIDDRSGRTLVSASSVDKESKKNLKGGGNVASAKAVGKFIADRAKAAGVYQSGFRPRRVQVSRPGQGARRCGAGSGVTVLIYVEANFA